MSLIEQLKSILSQYNVRPAKIRGQNFLIDEEVLDEIISAAEIKSSETILEIGPGLGFLTERLLARAKKVIAVELDAQLFKILREKFSGAKNLELVNRDILKINLQTEDYRDRQPPPSREDSKAGGVPAKAGEPDALIINKSYKIVANIPYEITSAILQKFLTCVLPPEEIVLMVQKEVAERIVNPKKHSLLNISVGLYGEPEAVATVPSSAFYPEPEVTSAILRIKVKKLSATDRQNNEKALKIAKIGFISPRKKLINNLSVGLAMPKENLSPVFTELGLNENIRAEELEPTDWLRLEAALKNIV